VSRNWVSLRQATNHIRDLVGDAFLYSYSPGDRLGTRYVFTDGTFLGRSAAIKHAEELAAKKEGE